MNWNRSLTGRYGLHFAAAPQAGLVCRVDVAVVVGGGMQVLHHCRSVGVGQVERLSGGLRANQQEVVVCRWYFGPFNPDWGTWNCLADNYLRRVGNWEEMSNGEYLLHDGVIMDAKTCYKFKRCFSYC